MAKVLHKCPTCSKVATTKSEMKIMQTIIRTYQCGHVESFVGSAPADRDTLDITSMDGKRPFPYQLEGAQFAERADMRCLIADEMGLGKTVQATMLAVAHPEVRPVIACVKSGLRMQWFKELVRWGDLMCQIIDGATAFWIPGMDVYIISQDTAWRIGWKSRSKKEKQEAARNGDLAEYVKIGLEFHEIVQKMNIKMMIIDECQQIKNASSKRSIAIQKASNVTQHVIALSGTPIMNNAAEYFPILNIIRPDKFPDKNQFIYGWCDTYFDGARERTGGLKNPYAFQDYTKDFIIRRERAEVLPDLPKIFRQNSFSDLGEMVEEEYAKTQKDFNNYYDGDSDSDNMMVRSANLLAYLARMRHLTGLSKIDPCAEFIEEFITSTSRKIVIFVHHKDVGAILQMKLMKMAQEWPAEWGKGILSLTSDLDMVQREDVVTKFKSSDYRVLVASTLASAEGLNLQFCSDCIMLERQWNPGKEEQAEARFPRPGSTADKINANYFIAVGTIDEFFSELVERKREIVTSALNGEATTSWNETSLMQELMQIIRQKGGQKWGF